MINQTTIEPTQKRRIRRGDIYFADLNPVVGSEQGGLRPCLVIQNEAGNRHSPTVIVAALTCRTSKAPLPTHVFVSEGSGLCRQSVVLTEQIRTIDRFRLRECVGKLDSKQMSVVDRALAVSVGLKSPRLYIALLGFYIHSIFVSHLAAL